METKTNLIGKLMIQSSSNSNIRQFDAGNQVSFVCDRALTREYPTKGYGLCIDLTSDKTTGNPALAKFSPTGKDFMTNKIVGVGGYDGRTSGEVASNVAGSKLNNLA